MFAARYKISYNEGVQTIPVRADLGHMRGFFILNEERDRGSRSDADNNQLLRFLSGLYSAC